MSNSTTIKANIRLGKGTLHWPSVFTTAKNQKGEDTGKYDCGIIIDAAEPCVKQIEELVFKCALEKCGNDKLKAERLIKSFRYPTIRRPADEGKEGWGENQLLIKAGTKFAVEAFSTKTKQPVVSQEEVYHGAEGYVIVTGAYFYENSGNKGISLNLGAVLVTGKEGNPVGGGGKFKPTEDTFAGISEDDLEDL